MHRPYHRVLIPHSHHTHTSCPSGFSAQFLAPTLLVNDANLSLQWCPGTLSAQSVGEPCPLRQLHGTGTWICPWSCRLCNTTTTCPSLGVFLPPLGLGQAWKPAPSQTLPVTPLPYHPLSSPFPSAPLPSPPLGSVLVGWHLLPPSGLTTAPSQGNQEGAGDSQHEAP